MIKFIRKKIKLFLVLSIIVIVASYSIFLRPALAAISLQQTVVGSLGDGGGTSFKLSSWTPAANELILVAVAMRNNSGGDPTVSGNGLTFVQVAKSSNARIPVMSTYLFRAMGSSPTSGQITVNTPGNSNPVFAVASRFNGVDTSGTNGSGAIEAFVTNNAGTTDNDDMKTTITSLTNNTWAYSAGYHRNGTFSLPAGETAISINNISGTGGDTVYLSTWYESVSNPNTVTVGADNDLSNTVPWSTIAVIIKSSAPTTPTPSATRTPTPTVTPTSTPANTPTPTTSASGWQYRKKITIDETKIPGTSNLANFPVLVSVTDSDLAGKAQVSGNDIKFTAVDGTTKLAHQIEKYDQTTGDLVAWVNIPTINATANTIIYMYYGNASAVNQENPTGTWNSNYQGVWHLNEVSGIRFDSTANSNNLTDTNTVGTAVGIVGEAANFTSSNSEKLSLTDAAQIGLEPTGQMTFQAWVKTSGSSQTMGIIAKSDQSTFGYRMRTNSSGWIDCNVYSPSGGAGAKTVLNPFTTSSWNLVHCVYDGSYIRNYENGANNNSNAYSAGIGTGANDFEVGTRGSQYFNGDLDEVRIINTSLSSAWIEAEYNNMSSPSTFYAVGIEESVVSATPTGTPTAGPSPTPTITPTPIPIGDNLDGLNSIYSYTGLGYYILDTLFDGNRTIGVDTTIFLISGSLEIGQNFTLADPRDTVIFIVNGNIYIDGNVTNIPGVYISSETITFASGDQPIIIEGMAYAKSFSLNRTYRSLTEPTYQFIYQPKYLVSLLPFLGRPQINWKEVSL